MMTLFAMAGIAEAAFAEVAVLMFLSNLLIVILAIVTLLIRNRSVALLSLAIWALLAMFFQPWNDFFPQPTDDPDHLSFQSSYRSISQWWLMISIGLLTAVAIAILKSTQRFNHRDQ